MDLCLGYFCQNLNSVKTVAHKIGNKFLSILTALLTEKQDWKGVLFRVHGHSEGVLHATLRRLLLH